MAYGMFIHSMFSLNPYTSEEGSAILKIIKK